jgi:hypothetical protein
MGFGLEHPYIHISSLKTSPQLAYSKTSNGFAGFLDMHFGKNRISLACLRLSSPKAKEHLFAILLEVVGIAPENTLTVLDELTGPASGASM